MIWDKILDYCREKQIWIERTIKVTDWNIEIDDWNMLFGSGIEEQKDYIKRRDNIGGIRFFKEGGELSVVSHPFSYGGKKDKFEIMEIRDTDTEDVIGYLTEKEVIRYIAEWIK